MAGGAYWLAMWRPSQRRREASAAAAEVAEGVPERAETPLDDVPAR
jgi:hypothetical protein